MAAQKIFTCDFDLSFFAQFASSPVFCIFFPTLPIYVPSKEKGGRQYANLRIPM